MNSYLDVTAIFGSDVFNEAAMKQRLKPEIYNAWKQCIQSGSPLELDVANGIAEGMKQWAIEKGATKHNMVCLLHEKPFAGVNGSGKHNNWSLATDSDLLFY